MKVESRLGSERGLRTGTTPIYHTSGARGFSHRPAIYRGKPRLPAVASLVLLAFAALLAIVHFASARAETSPTTGSTPAYGPSVAEMIEGPIEKTISGSGYDAFLPRRNNLPSPPAVTANAYILVDMDTGATLATMDAHDRLPVASLTKIATAMTALSLAPAGRPLNISVDAARAAPNRMGILPGETLTVEELLYGLLLDSGNDAAAALAENLGGEPVFVRAMNALAADLGLGDTNFTNPAGFDDPEGYSTAYDMAVLGRHLIVNQPLLARIVSTPRRIIESSPDHGWFGPTNLNRLLTEYPGALGIKTGRTDSAGYTLIAAAERDGRRLLVVVLASEHHFDDAEILLDFGFAIQEAAPAG